LRLRHRSERREDASTGFMHRSILGHGHEALIRSTVPCAFTLYTAPCNQSAKSPKIHFLIKTRRRCEHRIRFPSLRVMLRDAVVLGATRTECTVPTVHATAGSPVGLFPTPSIPTDGSWLGAKLSITWKCT
jgi:hypothetical protein